MDILDHPLEAVAFRLYSLPEASAATGAAAWTCLAAVLAAAAAAGLWRLRSSALAAASTAALKPLDVEPSKEKEVSPETASSSARSPTGSAASTTTAPCPSPKERYTAYYYRDSSRVGCCDVDEEEGYEEAEEEVEEQDEAEATATDPFEWEVVRSLPLTPTGPLPLSPTAAEMGRYRSPTAFGSSSVVRLWDEAVDAGVTASASPRRRSRIVGTVSAF